MFDQFVLSETIRRRLYMTFLIALILLGVAAIHPVAEIYAAYGWVHFTRALAQIEPSTENVESAIDAFTTARMRGLVQPRLNSALGVAYSLQGDLAAANHVWASSPISPGLLLLRGGERQAVGDWDMAIHYYLGAAQQDRSSAAWFNFVRLCQLSLADNSRLTLANREQCEQYFAGNNHNLLASGDQFLADAWTWHEGTVLLPKPVQDSGQDVVPSMRVQGTNHAAWQGAYQWIVVPPDAKVRFSIEMRVDRQTPDLKLRPLYIGFTKPDGAPAGNFLESPAEFPSDRWVELVRTVQLPAAQGQKYQFAPVLLQGDGEVSVRQARVELVEK
jgi:hypothetical protein